LRERDGERPPDALRAMTAPIQEKHVNAALAKREMMNDKLLP
jgi:hypothetical protein